MRIMTARGLPAGGHERVAILSPPTPSNDDSFMVLLLRAALRSPNHSLEAHRDDEVERIRPPARAAPSSKWHCCFEAKWPFPTVERRSRIGACGRRNHRSSSRVWEA